MIKAIGRTCFYWLIVNVMGSLCVAQVWTSIGPMPLASTGFPQDVFTGRMRAVAVDPADSNHWLAGAASGGVWESRDSGSTWLPRTDSQPTLATGAIAFAPSDPKTIYVGTGEAGFGNWNKAGLGILKSTDGGQTWMLLGNTIFGRGAISWIRVDPSNANVVLAGTTRGYVGRNDIPSGYAPTSLQFGIYRSTDGGTTWAKTLSGEVSAFEVDPKNFSNQYAAIGNPFRPFLDPYLPSEDNGLYRSSDAGRSWIPIAGPWKTMAVMTGYIALAISPSQRDTVYASIQGPTDNQHLGVQPLLGLFRTDNAWDATPRWRQISTTATSASAYVGYCDQCAYAHVISIDPTDPETLFAGGRNLWRCLKCDTSPEWANIEPHSDHHSLVWIGNRLIDGNDHGLYSSTDRGANWIDHNATINAVQFFSGALHPSDPNFILGGTQDNLAVRWHGGTSWERMANAIGGFCEGEVAMSRKRPNTDWMCAYTQVSVSRTTDGLQTWARADAGVDHTGAAFPPPVKQCPSDDDVFVTGTSRMWRTNNFFSAAAPSWTSNGPVVVGTGLNTVSITAIAFAESDASCKTYAYGTPLGRLWLTTDGGNNWTDLDPGKKLPARLVSALAFDPANPKVLYAGFSGFDGTMPGHVFKSANALDPAPAWANVSPPADVAVDAIAIDPSETKSIYVGTDLGLWRSNDSGATWQRNGPETGLPNVAIYDIKIDPIAKRVFVFTFGRGVFALGLNAVNPPAVLVGGPRSPANGGTYIAGGLVPGSWAQVQGMNLSGVTRTWNDADFAGLGNQLPTKIEGVEVKVNGISAAVYYVSSTQVTFQVPNGTLPGAPGNVLSSGPMTVQVFRDGVGTNVLNTSGTTSSPAIFPIIVNGKNYPAAVFLDGKLAGDPSLGSPFRKAAPGDVMLLFATGVFRSSAGIASNLQILGDFLAKDVTVKVGDVSVAADAFVLVAPGEFQINFTIPPEFAALPEGEYPIHIELNNGIGTSSPATINSDPPGPLVIAIRPH